MTEWISHVKSQTCAGASRAGCANGRRRFCLPQSVVVKRSQRKLALGFARRFFTSPRLQAGNLNCLCPLLDVRRNRFRKLRRVAADRFDAEF